MGVKHLVLAKVGDNIVDNSLNMTQYKGLVLLPYLESVKLDEYKQNADFVLPAQRVCRPNADFRDENIVENPEGYEFEKVYTFLL